MNLSWEQLVAFPHYVARLLGHLVLGMETRRVLSRGVGVGARLHFDVVGNLRLLVRGVPSFVAVATLHSFVDARSS